MKLYLILETQEFAFKDGTTDYHKEVSGVFDNNVKALELVMKLLARCKAIVGEENVTREDVGSVWYTTVDGAKAHLSYKIEEVPKLNVELPDFS